MNQPELDILNLFEKWNNALATGNPDEVVKLYAPNAVLLPTLSDKIRHNHAEIRDYFVHFLVKKPAGKITESNICVFGDIALHSGNYTFTIDVRGERGELPACFTFVYRRSGGEWLIVEHHSSVSPSVLKI